jgi:phosphoribosylformimino-5-aminoimidazole carboxamide ribotide isomerase
MIVYPAIDVRAGKVVRLLHGNPKQETVYSDDPLAMAIRWKNTGARWVHIVNLDGALGEAAPILEVVRQIASTGLAIQFGGGIRSLPAVEQALQAGVSRVILGTMVVNHPEIAREAVTQFGAEAIVVALDAKDNQVAVEGWQTSSQWTPVALGQRFYADGVRHALYTDVSRDGDLSGVNISATVNLAVETQLEVIASGGVASLEDIRQLKATRRVAGVVIGRALYDNKFNLTDAIKLAGA